MDFHYVPTSKPAHVLQLGRMRRQGRVLALAAALGLAGSAGAQVTPDTVQLSLDEAVARAVEAGQEVGLARAHVDAASSGIGAARAAMLPTVGTTLTYTKTFASVFQGTSFTLPDSLRFNPDPTLTLDERVAYLEDMTPIAGLGGLGQLFADLPFGQEHAYLGALTAEQLLYAGGRVRAGMSLARNAAAMATHQYDAARADVELEVTRAYYDALLARAFEAIADTALAQAETFLSEERMRLAVGRASELDVLRAEVTAENLRPQRVQATSAAEMALLNLRRLVDLPVTTPIVLTTRLELEADIPAPATPLDFAMVRERRSALAAVEKLVAIRDEQVRIARAAFLPSVALQTAYTRQAFPGDAVDFTTDWYTDWTATLAVQVPLFSGGSRFAAVQQARADADAARLQYRQLEEMVELEYRQALGDRDRSWSEIAARRRTAAVAAEVHELTVLRYDQGLATHLEVSQARLGLLTARTQLAQALADYYIAEAALRRATGTGGVGDVGRERP